MKRWCGFVLLLACATSAVATQVKVSGAVGHAGELRLKAGARISDAALAAQPLPQAYMKAAAWLRPELLTAQQRLKAGVVFDITSLQQRARADDDQQLAADSSALLHWIRSMPVTGRQSPALLDPRSVEVNAPENHRLSAGDELYYPLRPSDIRVVGAVQQPCALPLVPMQDARLYLAACAPSAAADRDSIYVIEPEGRVWVQGVALWNRSEPLSLAPGAIIYVPLREGATRQVDATMNSDIAAFIATQLLPGPEAPR